MRSCVVGMVRRTLTSRVVATVRRRLGRWIRSVACTRRAGRVLLLRRARIGQDVRMTLAELRAALDALDLPDDTIVVLSKDGEGNRFSPLDEAEHAMYAAETTWSGDRYLTEEERQAQDDPDEYSEAPDDAVHALFLWPVN